MDRFYVKGDCKSRLCVDDKDEVRHITKVMRMEIGDKFEVFDSQEKEYLVQISALSKEKVDFIILEEVFEKRELETKITLYQGIPKQQKMEFIIQKTTELGVHKIVPCNFRRCVSEIKEKEDKKIQRWQKIALESAKQSKRLSIPTISSSMSLNDVIEDMKSNELNVLFYELEKTKSLKEILDNIKNKPKSVGIIVGPEGGFEKEEVEKLRDNDAISLSLGQRILRTETAAMYGVTIFAYQLQ